MGFPDDIPAEMPSLHRPTRQEDPEVHLREEVIVRGRKLGEANDELEKARLALRTAEEAVASAERGVAMRKANWTDALDAYLAYREGNS